MNYIVYNAKGKILRRVQCPPALSLLQAKDDEYVMEGIANDVTQKIVNDKVVDKTPEEIEVDNPTPPEIPFEKQTANITNEQWQDIKDRLVTLEAK